MKAFGYLLYIEGGDCELWDYIQSFINPSLFWWAQTLRFVCSISAVKALVLWNNLVYFLLLGTFLLIGCPSRLHLEQSESWAFGLGITCTYSKPFELWTCLIRTSAIVTVWNSPTFMLGNYGATFVTLQSVISSWITAEENMPMADPV